MTFSVPRPCGILGRRYKFVNACRGRPLGPRSLLPAIDMLCWGSPEARSLSCKQQALALFSLMLVVSTGGLGGQ